MDTFQNLIGEVRRQSPEQSADPLPAMKRWSQIVSMQRNFVPALTCKVESTRRKSYIHAVTLIFLARGVRWSLEL